MLDKPSADADAQLAPAPRSSNSLAVLIVGMHRSGTSALGGMLNKLGVAVPEDLFPADQHNAKGYFEPRRIIDFHEALLAKLGSPSNDPLPLSYDWVESPVGEAAVEQLVALLDEEFGDNAMCLFKDPRMCRLAPVWTAALAASGRPGVAILPCRHPLEVAGSLQVKGALSRPYSLFMWLQHVLLGERFTRGLPRSFTFYDQLMDDWRGVAEKLQRDLKLAWPRDLLRAGPDVDAFLSGGLRHHASRGETLAPHDPLDALCARTWTALHQLSDAPNDPAAMAELDSVWAAFEAGFGVFGPLVVSYQRDLGAVRDELSRTLSNVGIMEAGQAAVVQRVIADKDAERDAAIRLRDDEIRHRDRRIIELDKARQTARDRLNIRDRDLAWVQNEVAKRDEAIGHLNAQLAHASAVAQEAHARATLIETSNSWKFVTALRAPLTKSPGLRRLLRATFKIGWWTLTFKLGRKLQERRALLTNLPAAPGPVPIPEPVVATQVAPTIAPAPSPAPVAATGGEQVPYVVFLSGEPLTPGHAYRVARYEEAALAAGARTKVISREDVKPHLQHFTDADLVFIWRAHWDDYVEAAVEAARAGGAKILFDVDDLLMEPDLAQAKIIDGIRSQRFTEDSVRYHFGLMEKTFLAADYCSAPTEFLAQRLRRQGHPAFVLPNGFDEPVRQRSRLAARIRRLTPPDGLVRIGYATGSKTHQKDFSAAAEAIARILREHPEARLVLFRSEYGPVLDVDEFPTFDGLLDQVEWRALVPIQQLPDEMARFDINVAPLEVGNIFCESKSELKFFEAALADVVTIASPTGPFKKAVRDGVTGLLANTADEWYAALKQLVTDPDLRRRMARAAQFDALAEYGPERRAEAMTSLLEQTVWRGRRGARAFELELDRAERPRPSVAYIPPHEIVIEIDTVRASEATVVIPLYNYAHFVEEALDSVDAQTVADLDLIVVDDGSTDHSLSVAQRWIEAHSHRFNRVLLIRNEKNSGLAFTRNVAFANADTPFVLPLDADNRLAPDCVEKLVAAAKESGAAYAYPQLRYFGDVPEAVGGKPYDPGRFVLANYIDAMALIRRSAWAAAGGYDHVQFGWEDYDFWCRLVERGMYGHHVAEPLADYRVHGQSMLRSETDTLRNKLKLVKDIEARHPWLHIDRDPVEGPKLVEPPPPAGPKRRGRKPG